MAMMNAKMDSRAVRQQDLETESRDSNDSGNELSVGGSSSEGDSMSHHQLDHSPNGGGLNHSESLHGSLNETSSIQKAGELGGTMNMGGVGGGGGGAFNTFNQDYSPAFKGSSLFDTPQSMISSPYLHSPQLLHHQQFAPTSTMDTPGGLSSPYDAFSPFGAPRQLFNCAVCMKTSQVGILQFICAHKTCQSCSQLTPLSADFRSGCAICGAGIASAANFPPQMFLSPTLSTPPHGGLLLDTNNRNNSTPQQPRAFSFSLNGLSGVSSPVMQRLSDSPNTSGFRQFPSMTLNDMEQLSQVWSPLQPSPLALKSLGGGENGSNQQSFDTLSVMDDAPVFSPLSPTNTSTMLPPALTAETPRAAIAPPPRSSISSSMTMTPKLMAQSGTPIGAQYGGGPSQFAMPPNQQQFPSPTLNGIQCLGCEANPSFAYCVQCQEALCQHCIQAHQRVRATKAHQFVELNLIANLMQRGNPQLFQSGFMNGDGRLGSAGSGDGHVSIGEHDSLSGDSSPRSSSVCSTHESLIVGYCEHCPNTQPLCAICVASHPTRHRVQPTGDLRVAVSEMTQEGRLLEWQCEKTGETIRRIMEGIVTNATTAENEVIASFDAHAAALEERRRDLLKRIESVKSLKLSILFNQAEKLKDKQADLKQIVRNAQLSLDDNDLDEQQLRQLFERLTACQMTGTITNNVGQAAIEPNNNLMNVLMLACQVNEDDRLKFIAPQDGLLLNKVRQFGNIESGPCAKTSSIVGDGYKKAIRERQTVIYVQLRDGCGDLLSSSNAAIQPAVQPLLPHQTPQSHLDAAMPTSDVQAFVLSPDGTTLDVTLTPRENGIVAVSYYPVAEGSYTLNVLVKGTPINGCPTTMEVRRGRNYDDIAARGPILTFGSEGSGDGELCRPWGICVDLNGRVLVADRSNNRVQIFNKDGVFLTKFGTSGNRPGQFDRPAGITTNTLNNIIVADKDNHRIQVFDENGNFLLKFGDRGRAVGYFNYPWGVATNSHNAIAVSDTRNHRVQIFTPQGQFVRKCGFDSAYFFKNLDSPRGLCYLPDGQLLITDFNNHRLAVLSPRNMSEMKVYGSEGDSDGMFVRPQGVVIDPEGHILVCDSRNNRIQVFSSDDMRFIGSFGLGPTSTGFQMPTELATPYSSIGGPFGAPGFSATPTPVTPAPRQLLDRPTDLAVGPDGRIYVVDFGNNCIRVF